MSWPPIVTDGLVHFIHAGHAHGPWVPGNNTTRTPWQRVFGSGVGAYDWTLSNFVWDATSGWEADGLVFNASATSGNDVGVLGNAAGLKFGSGARSLDCWVYWQAMAATPSEKTIFSSLNTVGGHFPGWACQLDYSAGTHGHATMYIIQCVPGTKYRVGTAGGTEINASTWYHLAFVYPGAGTDPLIYIDGALDPTMSYGGAQGTWNTDSDSDHAIACATAQIGERNDSTSEANMRLGSLRVYNKALSAAEVLQNYRAGRLWTPGMNLGVW